MQLQYELFRDRVGHTSAFYVDNDQFLPHFHSTVELVYVEEGFLQTTQEGVVTLCGPGTLILNSCYLLHGYATPEHSRVLVVTVPPDAVPSLRAQLHSSRFRTGILSVADRPAYRTLMRLMAEYDAKEETRFVDRLGEALLTLAIAEVGMEEVPGSAQNDMIRNVLEYMQNHLQEPITAASVAAEFGYSEGRFMHLFTKRVGITFLRYLQSLRCSYASALLRSETVTLPEIAEACGFTSLRSFHRVYRQLMGVTPRGANE